MANVALLRFAPSVTPLASPSPSASARSVATGCQFGGRAGAYPNDGLSGERVLATSVAVYLLVGVFVVGRTVVLGGAGH